MVSVVISRHPCGTPFGMIAMSPGFICCAVPPCITPLCMGPSRALSVNVVSVKGPPVTIVPSPEST